MSTTADLVTALKKELKTAQMTYADLAQALGMAESSVKRMLAKGDMPLSRIDAICRALALDFADLARRVADSQPLLREVLRQALQALDERRRQRAADGAVHQLQVFAAARVGRYDLKPSKNDPDEKDERKPRLPGGDVQLHQP